MQEINMILTLIQPGKGRFTIAYVSLDYLNNVFTWLPGFIRVKEPVHTFLEHFLS